MRILIVEDNEKFITQIEPLLREISHVSEVLVARDRDSALEIIRTTLLDLIVLDLSIPPTAGSMAIAQEHGQFVFHYARDAARGTPIFILTGSQPDEFSRRLAKYGQQFRLWGAPEQTETVSYFIKEETGLLLERVGELAHLSAPTDAIAINTRGKELGFSAEEQRILRVFARLAGGVAVDVKLLNGGLSDSKVVQAAVKDGGGRILLACAGKMGGIDAIKVEHAAYQKYVKRLRVGTFPTQFCMIDHGVRTTHGTFYTLADNTQPLFDVLRKVDSKNLIERLRGGLDRWISAAQISEVAVHDIRRHLLKDNVFRQLTLDYQLDWLEQVEAVKLQASKSVIHGDLHCGNVLVGEDGSTVFIDFGDVGPGFTCLDPITLELSLLFHPEGVRQGYSAELASRIEHWPMVDTYVSECSLSGMIGACRGWAYDVGGGDLDVLASGYAFAIRQLKYRTVDPAITLTLVESIGKKILSS